MLNLCLDNGGHFIVIFAFNRVILTIAGDIGVSAYSIVANLSLICAAIFTGVGQAIQPLVSVNYGAGKMERVYQVMSLGLYTALALGLGFYLVGLAFPEYLVFLFTAKNTELLATGVQGIRLYFLAFPAMSLNIAITSYIQSKEQGRASFIMSLTRGLGLILLCLLTLPKLFGLNGVWLTMPVTEFLTLILAGFALQAARRAVGYTVKRQPLLMRARRFVRGS